MKSVLGPWQLVVLGLLAGLVGCQKEKPDAIKIEQMLEVLGQVHDLLDKIQSSEDAEAALPVFREKVEHMVAINGRPGSYEWHSGSSKSLLKAYLVKIKGLLVSRGAYQQRILEKTIEAYRREASVVLADVNR